MSVVTKPPFYAKKMHYWINKRNIAKRSFVRDFSVNKTNIQELATRENHTNISLKMTLQGA